MVWNNQRLGGEQSGQLKLADYGRQMPETTTDDVTATVDECIETVNDSLMFRSIRDTTVEQLEEFTPEERGNFLAKYEETSDEEMALWSVAFDVEIPAGILPLVPTPEEWDTLDTSNIEEEVCQGCDTSLYHVELNENFDADTSYLNENGSDYGGDTIDGDEYEVIAEDSTGFLCGNCREDIEAGQATEIVFHLPGDTDTGEHPKGRVEVMGNVVRDAGYDDENLEGYRDTEDMDSLIPAIIKGNSDAEILEDYVPLEARGKNGGRNTHMEEYVEEVADADEYYHDFPTVAVLKREGLGSGKRYLVVPQEQEDMDEVWLDPAKF